MSNIECGVAWEGARSYCVAYKFPLLNGDGLKS
jgi:hypothetical protein